MGKLVRLHWPVLALLMSSVMTLLQGCASPTTTQGPTTDTVTESDEPESRKRARIRMELAIGYFEQGKTRIALDEIKQVISSDPSFPDAYGLRGLIYMRMNDMAQAEDSFKRAIALNPQDANAHHNYGWLLCQQAKYPEAIREFGQAMAKPLYGERARTLMAQGVCQARAGQNADAERSLAQSYELDAADPVTGFNLAKLLFLRGELTRAQFYIRRLNNTELANSESLWLGIKVERQIGDRVAMDQLADQLRRRFSNSREAAALARGAFNE
jgi:type IV pilus assembly protein PilF